MSETAEQVLERAARLFHEIGSAIAADDLLCDARNVRNARLAESLREKQRTPDQLRAIAADGFESCVRVLAQMGASDVTVHECGTSAWGEEPWGGIDE